MTLLRITPPLPALSFLVLLSIQASAFSATLPVGVFECPITISSGDSHHLEVDGLRTSVWSLGVVLFTPKGPGMRYDDGSLGMKWHWYRDVQGDLRISGRRLDGEAPPLRAEIPEGYGSTGFQATGLIFPTPGCWEVTGVVGESKLTFVTMVIDVCAYGSLCG